MRVRDVGVILGVVFAVGLVVVVVAVVLLVGFVVVFGFRQFLSHFLFRSLCDAVVFVCVHGRAVIVVLIICGVAGLAVKVFLNR